MTNVSLGQDLKETKVLTASQVQKIRADLETRTKDSFKEIDRNKSFSLDEARTKYLD